MFSLYVQTSCFLFLDYYVLIITAFANWTWKEKASSEKMCAVRNDTVGEVHLSKNKAKNKISVINDPHLHLYTYT